MSILLVSSLHLVLLGPHLTDSNLSTSTPTEWRLLWHSRRRQPTCPRIALLRQLRQAPMPRMRIILFTIARRIRKYRPDKPNRCHKSIGLSPATSMLFAPSEQVRHPNICIVTSALIQFPMTPGSAANSNLTWPSRHICASMPCPAVQCPQHPIRKGHHGRRPSIRPQDPAQNTGHQAQASRPC